MLEKRYYWKELTEDGLLKEPNGLGPYYSTVSLNDFDGFESEEEAVEHYESIISSFKFRVPYKLVLIIEYSQV